MGLGIDRTEKLSPQTVGAVTFNVLRQRLYHHDNGRSTIQDWIWKHTCKFACIWRLVLSLDKYFSSSDDLPHSRLKTVGTFFDFDLKQGNAIPEARLYTPAKQYGRDELAVAEGLGTYHKGKPKVHYVDNYMRALEEVCKHRPLDSYHGLQTYVGCEIEREKFSITSYIASEIYHPARWSKLNSQGLYTHVIVSIK